MNIPIKTDGRIYLDLKIDPKTAYNILCRECIENGKFALGNENDGYSKNMINSLTAIRDKYSKVFGKNGEEALLPVKGFFDSENNSFYITSNEVIKGLYHVFEKDFLRVKADARGIWESRWSRGLGDDKLLYEGQDAADVYEAMESIRQWYDGFVQANDKSVGQIKR